MHSGSYLDELFESFQRRGGFWRDDRSRLRPAFRQPDEGEWEDREFSFSGFPGAVLDALRNGLETVAVKLAVAFGFRDETTLTNLVFFARHPERGGRKLAVGEPGLAALSKEWLDIRAGLVRPAIKKGAPAKPAGPIGPFPDVNIMLPKEGVGFSSKKPDSRRYGLPETIKALKAIAAAWFIAHPKGPRIIIGDISKRGGGQLCMSTGRCHKSHRIGLDVDIRPIREDLKDTDTRLWISDKTYSSELTAELINLIKDNSVLAVKTIAFADTAIPDLSRWDGHRDHLHVRFCLPPGYGHMLKSIPKGQDYRC